MKNKICIIFVILAFTLNFLHDFQKHDHHEVNIYNLSNHKVTPHFHDSISGCKFNENEDNEQPFQHCNFEHAHDNILLRNTQTSIHIADLSNYLKTVYHLHLPLNSFKEFINENNSNSSQSYIGLSISLRAPPSFS